VVYGGTAYVMKMYQVDILMQDLPIPQWIPRIVLPIGFLLLAFRFSEALWRLATGQQDQLLGDEVEDAMKLQQVDPSVGGVK
jgi:C4-dicarboxylate transporter DctQ subunit